MALTTHAEQMHIEKRCRRPEFGIHGEDVLVGLGSCRDVCTELAVAGRHRVDVARGDVDVVQQCLAGLFLVSLVVIVGDEPVVTPEQMHARPVDRVGAEVLEQSDPGSAAGQNNHREAAVGDRIVDRCGESITGTRDKCFGVGKRLDDDVVARRHAQSAPTAG